jgi:hypothetical protein
MLYTCKAGVSIMLEVTIPHCLPPRLLVSLIANDKRDIAAMDCTDTHIELMGDPEAIGEWSCVLIMLSAYRESAVAVSGGVPLSTH